MPQLFFAMVTSHGPVLQLAYLNIADKSQGYCDNFACANIADTGLAPDASANRDPKLGIPRKLM